MNAQTLRALKASIRHWERLVAGNKREKVGMEQCALCRRFNSHVSNSQNWSSYGCDGCPVKAKTGANGCIGTPYQDAHDAFDNIKRAPKRFKVLAKKELKFLKSLLP